MFEYCKSDIKGINFIKVSKEDIEPVRQMLSTRFESGKTIPGTRSFHHFSPLSEGEVTYKRVSEMKLLLEHSNFLTLCWQTTFPT